MASFTPRPPYPVQNLQYLLRRRMCASLGRTGRFEQEENFLPLPGFESRIVQSYAVLSKYSMNPVKGVIYQLMHNRVALKEY